MIEELPKNHEAMPDGLGAMLGVDEERIGDGEVAFFLQRQPGHYIVLGNYAEGVVENGKTLYVADYTDGYYRVKSIRKFETIIEAVAHITLLVEDYKEKRNAHVHSGTEG